ncbi:hypothetical protein BGW36DRAFT_294275 [Talaromyces proteolyticus]|uniref:Lipase B n=1 Tax=Talaromyces proteolyticus TaxID=1131652 RepID=A0AAD4Q1Z3_9EURO|nr:uncharacterized protein BGW36DRAFT_294275 [Talaromyces proteolyticus]KAH8699194.1 hypothetical protein BGW36DRAFT_294275 [Talaromyces proteolyticus]
MIFSLILTPLVALASPTHRSLRLLGRETTGVNSFNNTNLAQPATTIFPQKASSDAPFSLSENTLRSAIYIPSTFEYGSGSKSPVILIPGTSLPAGTTYSNGFGKLLANTSYADPVWVNIPGYSLGDAQVNAEYVAYAINYIAGVSKGKNISLVSWSQGGPNIQWSLKYWPSTREVVNDFVALSPDFKGTTEAILICSGLTGDLCEPSILQQENTSEYIATLRNNGGDSAYVPTTTFYSSTDEIVQPQDGKNASAYILDARNVGVTNNQVQSVCSNSTQIVLHEGALYNSVAWGLIEDALTHDGPGQISRLDIQTLCKAAAAPGLDSLLGESIIVNAVPNILAYHPKATKEPAIASYAG